jgi:hypothetical protein
MFEQQGIEESQKIVLKTFGRFKKRVFLCNPLSKEGKGLDPETDCRHKLKRETS